MGITMKIDALPTPCYVVDKVKIINNLKILRGVMDRTGARILLAQKAFSMYELYPLIGEYLAGATASGLFEAKLCAEEMVAPLRRKIQEESSKWTSNCTLPENHIFSPAYKQEDFEEIVQIADHIVFNSIKQLKKYGTQAKSAGKSIGLRINPEVSTQEGHEIYDPCAKGSRLGVTRENLVKALEEDEKCLDLLDGFHFHTLCEQDADALEVTLDVVVEKFGQWMQGHKWINFGGGHHITKPGYDIALLEKCIKRMQNQYGLQVYLEPGEAIALNAGYLITTVLEKITNHMEIAIVDTSAACHMPDVIEMPYRAPLKQSGEAYEKAYTYRLGGPTCLAGDIIGDYSFDTPLEEGSKLIFEDMAIYSMVKNNTFNGIPLPGIALMEENGECRLVKQFDYLDFKNRLS